MPKGKYVEVCTKCLIYPVAGYAPDSGLCHKCSQEKRINDEAIERQEQMELKKQFEKEKPAPPPKSSSVAHCGACLTTLNVWYVSEDGKRLCVRCKSRHSRSSNPIADSLAAVWGRRNHDPNASY